MVRDEDNRSKMAGWGFLWLRRRKRFLTWSFLRFLELRLCEVCKILSLLVPRGLTRQPLLLAVP